MRLSRFPAAVPARPGSAAGELLVGGADDWAHLEVHPLSGKTHLCTGSHTGQVVQKTLQLFFWHPTFSVFFHLLLPLLFLPSSLSSSHTHRCWVIHQHCRFFHFTPCQPLCHPNTSITEWKANYMFPTERRAEDREKKGEERSLSPTWKILSHHGNQDRDLIKLSMWAVMERGRTERSKGRWWESSEKYRCWQMWGKAVSPFLLQERPLFHPFPPMSFRSKLADHMTASRAGRKEWETKKWGRHVDRQMELLVSDVSDGPIWFKRVLLRIISKAPLPVWAGSPIGHDH